MDIFILRKTDKETWIFFRIRIFIFPYIINLKIYDLKFAKEIIYLKGSIIKCWIVNLENLICQFHLRLFIKFGLLFLQNFIGITFICWLIFGCFCLELRKEAFLECWDFFLWCDICSWANVGVQLKFLVKLHRMIKHLKKSWKWFDLNYCYLHSHSYIPKFHVEDTQK